MNKRRPSKMRSDVLHFPDATDLMRNVLTVDLVCRRVLHISLPNDILLCIFKITQKEERKLKKQKKQLPETPHSGDQTYTRERGAHRQRCKTKVKIKRAMRYYGR